MNKYLYPVVLLLLACGGTENYVPKPHGFPRMVLPAKKYRMFDTSFLPYAFEQPVYSRMEKDTNSNLTAEKTWYNLNFVPFGATLHITYYRFNNWDLFDSLLYDTRKLVNKHIQRADDILEETVSADDPKVKGVLFRIDGNTATNLNFFLTDSSHHFLRGALYFNSKTQQDSIAPVYEYLNQDIRHLIKTFKWK